MRIELDTKNKTVRVSMVGITAALYVALGYIFQPINSLGLQFRVAELIVGMCIIFPYAGLIGNVLGVFFVNLTSPLGILDWVIGPIGNVPALMCIVLLRNRKYLKYLGGILYASIISLYVAAILWYVLNIPFFLSYIQVFISEIILAELGIFLFDGIKMRLEKV
jgi:uncharacterized membrane protein